MKSLTGLTEDGVRESLEWRHSKGTLVAETIPSLIVMRNTFQRSKPRRGWSARTREKSIAAVNWTLAIALKVAGLEVEPEIDMRDPKLRQVQLYVMAGGGLIGRFAAEQPGCFYIDTRAAGGRPFSDTEVYKEVAKFAKDIKADRSTVMGRMIDMHNCGLEW